MKGYKFIQMNMKSRNGNHIWKVGKWYKSKDIIICEKGFHACKKPVDSLNYIYGDRWFEIEAGGKIIEEGNKFVASEMRLIREIPIDRIVKRFAIFCAKSCLANYEKIYPNDKRVSEAIKGAENYLDGKIDLIELNKKIFAVKSAVSAVSAANSAAYSAANSANKELLSLIKINRNTLEIFKLENREIFVFGSNELGNHSAGAAKLALKFGAKEGIGEGLNGNTYAFPTLDKQMKKRTIKQLKESVKKLIKCANENKDNWFLVTKVGCGIAGFKEPEIKSLFKNIKLNNIILPKGWK